MNERLPEHEKESFMKDPDQLAREYQKIQAELHRVRLEQAKDRRDLERAVEQSSILAVEAEIANVELNQIINTSLDGMMLVYDDFTVKRINEALLSVLGVSRDDAAGRKCYDLFPDDWCGTDECPIAKLRSGQDRVEVDVKRIGKNGVPVPFMFTATPFRGVDGEMIGMVSRFKDITERKYAEDTLRQANEQLERLATIDGITRVANRRSFDETIEREWNRLKRTEEPLSLIICNVDFFKTFNDARGSRSGNDCLRSVAATLKEQVHRGGDYVARFGEEEFALILPETDEPGALHVAEKLRRVVENMVLEHGSSPVSPYVTVSLGVATMVPLVTGMSADIIGYAARALSRAVSSGGNRVVVWDRRDGRRAVG